MYPYNCARAVRATDATAPSKAREVSQGKAKAQEKQNDAETKTTKSKGDEAHSPRQDLCREAVLAKPARPLPWQLAPHLRSESPLSPLPPWGKDSGDIPVVAC